MADQHISEDGHTGGVSTRFAQNVYVTLALLERGQEETNSRFRTLGDKFDKILDRMEQLTLHTATLITTHDSEIKYLRQQMESTTAELKETQTQFTRTTEKLATELSEDLTNTVARVESSVETIAARVTKLEQWRFTLVGGGIAMGAVLLKVMEWLIPAFLSKVGAGG